MSESMTLDERKKKKYQERIAKYGDNPLSYSIAGLLEHFKEEVNEFLEVSKWEKCGKALVKKGKSLRHRRTVCKWRNVLNRTWCE
jgi:hypothetical protein